MVEPYVGLSGLMTRADVDAAIEAFPDCGRKLMVGVLVSAKTLRGERNKYWRRYPRIEDVANIFSDDHRCLNLVHYASDDVPTRDTLERLLEVAGPRCHGFQFNGAWPQPADRHALEERCHGGRIVLQFKTQPYLYWPLWAGRATDILLDASGGHGIPMDPARTRMLVEIARGEIGDGVGIGIAGALCAETLPAVADLVRGGCSIDAEGKLRDDADGGGNLHIDKVRAYLRAAGEILQ